MPDNPKDITGVPLDTLDEISLGSAFGKSVIQELGLELKQAALEDPEDPSEYWESDSVRLNIHDGIIRGITRSDHASINGIDLIGLQTERVVEILGEPSLREPPDYFHFYNYELGDDLELSILFMDHVVGSVSLFDYSWLKDD